MELYYEDAYLKSFSSRVVSVSRSDGQTLITLERTAFFPGGGGQSFDTGVMKGKNGSATVIETRADGERIVHVCAVEGSIAPGDSVQCSVNWERRYELMRAHTAQHMFFQCLSRYFEGLRVVKDDIDVGRHALFITSPKPLDFGGIAEAEKLANSTISEGRRVLATWVRREEARSGDFRVKSERLKGNEVRVIEIEGFDKSACLGVHVRNTSEISLLAVKRMTHDGNEYVLEFEFGEKAREFLIYMKRVCMSTCSILQTQPELLEKTVENLKSERTEMFSQIRELNEKMLKKLEYSEKGGMRIYSKLFSNMDDKKLMERAGELIKEDNTMVIFGNRRERGFLLIAKNQKLSINLNPIAGKAFELMGGKWGGKDYFILGAGNAETLEKAFNYANEMIGLDVDLLVEPFKL